MLKVHSLLIKHQPNLEKDILKKAKEFGLHKLLGSKNYTLRKLREKNPSVNGIISKGEIITGRIYLIGNTEGIALYFDNNHTWFKTSLIIDVKKQKNKLRVETMNSIYVIENI